MNVCMYTAHVIQLSMYILTTYTLLHIYFFLYFVIIIYHLLFYILCIFENSFLFKLLES